MAKSTIKPRAPLKDSIRGKPKRRGGKLEKGNVAVMEPRDNMERNDTLRERDDVLEELKSLFDDRVQTMKLLMKINNQLLAYQRRVDHRNPATELWLTTQLVPVKTRLDEITRDITKKVKELATVDPFVKAALGVPYLGPITVAALQVYVDLEKADSASALWKYVGHDKASHERYSKGEASGGNKTLRTVLYNAACNQIKGKSNGAPYFPVYENTKRRLENSAKVTKTRNTQGKLVEKPWSEVSKGHRHGAALRVVVKHILADYWFVGRELAGLSTRPVYAQSQLGHQGIIKPRDRGWEY